MSHHRGVGHRRAQPVSRGMIPCSSGIGLAGSLVLLAVAGCHPGAESEGVGTPEAAAGESQQAINPAQFCVSIQRQGASGAVFDTGIADKPTPKNYGASGTMNAGPVAGGDRQSLIQFDLSAIPSGPGTNIQTASVTLTRGLIAPTGPGSIDVHNVLAPWSESTVTWQSLDRAFDPIALTTFDNQPASMSFSLRQTVDDWVQERVPNHGVLLRSADGVTTNFWTSEYAVPDLRPRLDVCYQLPDPCDFNPCPSSVSCTDIGSDFICGCVGACACAASCDDGIPCTVDSCDAVHGCVHDASACGPQAATKQCPNNVAQSPYLPCHTIRKDGTVVEWK